MKKTILVLLLAGGFSLLGRSQSVAPFVIASAGEYYSNASGSIQWTMGETMTETYGSASNFITQGFEQPNDFGTSIVSTTVPVNVGLFPNPATDHVNLTFGNDAEGDYVVGIFDVLGQQIGTQKINVAAGATNVEIALGDIANGVYFITVTRLVTGASSTFKVNKVS